MLLVAGDAAATARLAHASAVLPTGNELVRAAVVPGVDGGRYLVAANFGLKETTVTLRPPGGSPLADLRLAPLDTLVLELQRRGRKRSLPQVRRPARVRVDRLPPAWRR
jgi:hypothetical protein